MRMMLLVLLTASLFPSIATAALHTSAVDYRQGNAALEGYIAYKEGITGKAPGILVVHDWMGLNDHYKKITEKLADLGYIAFAVDIYGKGVRPKDSQQAAVRPESSSRTADLCGNESLAGLEELKKNKNVDHESDSRHRILFRRNGRPGVGPQRGSYSGSCDFPRRVGHSDAEGWEEYQSKGARITRSGRSFCSPGSSGGFPGRNEKG